MGNLCAQSRRTDLGLRFLQITDLFFDRSRVFHHRTEVTEGDPRRRDTISDQFLGRATTTGSYTVWASTEVSEL